jgi:hypothetical protein
MSTPAKQEKQPPVTARDRACAVLARAALFPISVDWSGKHHAIRPALQALDLVRVNVTKADNLPFSKLFPRHVIVVPSPSGGMQWNGQPDITESSIEVIPNKLTVRCMECGIEKAPGAKSFTQTKEDLAKNVYQEIVLCTDRLLQSDYNKVSDPTLLEQRRDLPPRSLAIVEEELAHQISKIHQQFIVDKNTNMSACEKLATLELHAARMAECLYRKEGTEIHRGSALRPLGFSLLPRSLQEDFRSRCARVVAVEATSREFGNKEGKKCVSAVLEKTWVK